MQFVVRVVRSACDLITGTRHSDVGLRHHSGPYFTGAPAGGPVRFGSVDAARGFARRFLDEAPGWEPVTVAAPEAPRRAA